MTEAQDILDFWFLEAGAKQWFKRSDAFDDLCRRRFASVHEAASRGECWVWRQSPGGRCAEIIVLDQLSRNLYRGSARAFAQDGMALVLAQEAVASGADRKMSDDERYFTYMPFMHSESAAIHEKALGLFEALGHAEALRYERAHRAVIERFGRYPARNAALDRQSTEAELRYLETHPGF